MPRKVPKATEEPQGFVDGLKWHEGPQGGVYYYQAKICGQVYRGSTDTRDIRDARAFLDALRTEVREKAKRGEISRLSLPRLEQIYDLWAAEMAPKASAAHLRSVDSYWRLHIAPHLGQLTLDKVSTARVEACRAAYLDGGGTNGGANSLLVALNALFGWAIRHDYLTKRPFTVGKLKVQRAPRAILPGELAPRFLAEVDKAKNPHVRACLRLMVGLGLREDEALTARWEWLDLHHGTYTPGKTKGREAVALHLPTWLAKYLQGLKGDQVEGLMFPSDLVDEETKAPLSHVAGFTKRAVARAAKELGLKGLTPHRLRATFATLHTDAGTPVPEVQRLLRHKNISTTLRYIETGRAAEVARAAQSRVAQLMGLEEPPKAKKPAKGNKNGNKSK